jgi:hypothetical protein
VGRRFSALLLAVTAVVALPLAGQETEHEAAEHEATPRHRLALFTGNTWIPQADHHGGRDGFVAAPTIGIDYNLHINERFSLGLINDVELASYVVELEDGTELEKEFVFVSALVGMWSPANRLILYAGPGLEFESHSTFAIVKVGAEYEIFEPHPWDVTVTAAYDIKEHSDTISIGLSIGRLFG